jgi:methyl-accepting chemotaxis protein
MNSISGLAADVQDATTAILDLERNSSDIGRVLDVIRAIAEQTNLLALNAAIEAARAGDQGRGFAVVADEVRTLAQRTGESTEEIHKMIDGLQTAIRRVSSSMEQSRQQAVSTADTANQAETALSAIGSAVDESRRLNVEIAGATDEQRNVTSTVQQTVMKMHNHMVETSAAAEASYRTAEDLRQLTRQMNETLNLFKTA